MSNQLGALTHGGTCITYNDDGKVGFIRGGIPGEVVNVAIDKELSKRFFGHVSSVITPSQHRKDVDGGILAGRELAHIDGPYRRQLLSGVIRDAFSRVGSRAFADAHKDLDYTVYTPGQLVACDCGDSAWRLRVDVTLDQQGYSCMYETGTHNLVRLDSCPFAAFDDRVICGRACASIAKPGQRVRVVSADNGLFACTDEGVFKHEGGAWQPTDETHATYHIMTDVYHVALDGFWQAHRCAALTLRTLLMRMVDEKSAWELYSGAGLFSVPLGRKVERLVTWEGSPQATKDARENCRCLVPDAAITFYPPATINGRSIRTFIADNEHPDVIILDPPRSGAGLDVIRPLAKVGAKKIIYVACDIASLARDGNCLFQAGYRITQLQCIDLFPETPHCECIGVFEQQN